MSDDPTRLLGEGDPAPARVLRPAGASEFFLTGDHAGRAIPKQLGKLGLPASELERHIAWDIGIAGVTERLAEALDATAVLQVYSRLVIDCNRHPGWASSIPGISELTAIPGNEAIRPAEREARRREIFLPYHQRIAELLDDRRIGGVRTVLVAMHSFTPVFKGVARPWDAAVLYNRDARLARPLFELLSAEDGLVVGDNEPYAVSDLTDYTVPVHGERRGLPHVEIEIRQDLIGDPAGQTLWAERLARLLPAAYSELLRRGIRQ